MQDASKPIVLKMYSTSTIAATRPAAAVEAVKSMSGVNASPATETTPSSINTVNSFLRMPRMSPNTPRNGALSATMAIARLVAKPHVDMLETLSAV